MTSDQIYSFALFLINSVFLLASFRVGEDGARRPAIRSLRLAFAALAGSWLLFAFVSSALAAIGSFVLAAAYFWLLVDYSLRRAGRPTPGLVVAALAALQIALYVLFYRSGQIRAVLHTTTFFALVACPWIGYLFLRAKPRRTWSDVAFGITLLLFLAVSAARSLLLVAQPLWWEASGMLLTQLLWPGLYAGSAIFAITGYMEEAQTRLQEQTRRDPLTGLLNRRGLAEALVAVTARADRAGEPVALIVADLDRFKSINDRHGHDVGDRVLAALAARFARELRASDLVARFGGEEFVVVMPETGIDPAVRCAERLRRAVHELDVASPTELGRLSASFGVAVASGRTPFDTLFRDADQALLRAKSGGRNRVEIATTS